MGCDRPRCCPELACEPLHNFGEVSGESSGDSWFCFGRMPGATTFVYAGVEHTNDLSGCYYTPLKGTIRNQENADDWFLMAHAYAIALWELGGRKVDCPQRPWALRKAVTDNQRPRPRGGSDG